MIKQNQYFNDFHSKIEFDAKAGGWVGQDFRVHMTLSVGTTEKCVFISSSGSDYIDKP